MIAEVMNELAGADEAQLPTQRESQFRRQRSFCYESLFSRIFLLSHVQYPSAFLSLPLSLCM
jgi:hypothetical protein